MDWSGPEQSRSAVAFGALMRNLPGLVYRCRNDRDWTIHYCSPGARELTGYEPDELVAGSPTYADLILPEDRDFVWEAVQANVAEARPYQIEYRIRTREGVIKWVWEQGCSPSADDPGAFLEGYVTDITDRVLAMQGQIDAAQRFQVLAESAPVGIFVVDAHRSLSYANPEFRRITGVADEDIADVAWEQLADPVYRERFRAARRALWDAGQPMDLELRIRSLDGELRDVVLRASLLVSSAGEPRGVVGSVADVTVLKQALDRTHQAEKMEALGRFASEIAHDFGNYLSAISMHAQLAERELAGEPADVRGAADRAARIVRTVKDATGLSRQLLTFARDEQVELRPVALHHHLEELEAVLAGLLGRGISLTIQPEAAHDVVELDPGQLHQVLLNLTANARDAMPEGGRLVIRTENPDGRTVRLSVRDTGVGMDEVTLSRAFEPFFTTKAGEGGTGLGLSATYGIVERSGGSISATSTPGRGSEMVLDLPLAR